MEIELQEEKIDQVRAEIEPILRRHWEEVALNRDKIKLNIDWDLYYLLEEAGKFRVFTARIGGQLVGYDLFFVHPHIHYKDNLYAVNDIFYVERSRRGRGVGKALFAFAEDRLAAMGVDVVYYLTKLAIPDSDALLQHLGYKHEGNGYAKCLIA